MLTLILLAAIFAVCVIWERKAGYQNEDLAFGTAIFFGLALAITVLTLCNKGKRFERTKEEYRNLEMQVAEYNTLPDSVKIMSLEYDIRKDVLEMNNTISKHKVMSKSLWIGPWNSEEIGRLPKLHIVSKDCKQENGTN